MSKFLDLINSETPTLLDFHATWCGPCKTLAPILSELKDHYKSNLKIIKIDVDRNQALAAKYGVRGVPNLLLFKNGKVLWQQSGVIPKTQLIQLIDPHL
jgi:thioredoxin 1